MNRLSIVSFVVGIAGFLFALSSWKPETKVVAYEFPSFSSYSFPSVGDEHSVSIDVDGVDYVTALRSYSVSIKNVGNRTLDTASVRSKLFVGFAPGLRPISPVVSFASNPDEVKYSCSILENKVTLDFAFLDPAQGFKCTFFLVEEDGKTGLVTGLKPLFGGRIQGWDLVRASDGYDVSFAQIVTAVLWGVMGLLVFVLFSWISELIPSVKRFTRFVKVVNKHEDRLKRIRSQAIFKFDLIGSRRIYVQFAALSVVFLAFATIFGFIWLGGRVQGFEHVTSELLGVIDVSTPLFD